MDRRRFLLTSLAGALAAPLAAEAQQAAKIPQIGVLGTNPPTAGESFQAFRKGLQKLGYVEGQHVHFDYRWPEGGPEGYPALVGSSSAQWGTILSSLPWSRASPDREVTPRAP